MISSNFIFNELHRVLVQEFKCEEHVVNESVVLLKSQTEIIIPQSLKHPTYRDTDNDQNLGTALAGHADCIVTGDKDLLIL
ncbi:MAG: putative toxin-antitoxin system toxin component, PIN family [bacterium]|nr:putative toxin-antitoxin system toxin component, PIN family [bacterium]